MSMINVALLPSKVDYIQKGVSIKIPMAYGDLECAFVQKRFIRPSTQKWFEPIWKH